MSESRKTNRTKILEFLFRNGATARATIAEQTNITPATVTTATAALIEEGIIEILGEEEGAEATPGRKRVLIDINAEYAYVIGIEFTERRICFCITNLRGKMIARKLFLATHFEISNITDFLISRIEELIYENMEVADRLIGIGIGVPGKLNSQASGIIEESAIWSSFDPRKIKQKFHLPVIIDNNVKSMACGQYLFRAQNTPETFSFFHLGIGMYCANIVNGEAFADNNYIAGEIGHTIVKIDGKKCKCGKRGCLQTYASERWLLKAAQMLLENNGSVILKSVAGDEEVNIEHIITAFQMGDELIRHYIVDAMRCIGMAISNLSILMNPSKIFLHGRLFDDEMILNRFNTYIEEDLKYMGKNYFSHIEVVPCDPMDGALGAAAKAIQTFFINE